ncbi:MAG: aminoglycoside phosphotransferase family protein, partial [Thermoleophilaceae bacterium]|nr:aminoglycoside phosphotransferase family protein [Thermoleophilaceae bacterium]
MTTTSSAADAGHAAEAWLCMLPAEARRFRVSDARLAAALAGSGGELVEDAPDVEIAGSAAELRGDAPVAAVALGRAGWASGSALARGAERSRASLSVRAAARAARRALRRLGYRDTGVAFWDVGQAFGGVGRRRSAVEHLPGCAIVFGHREPVRRTLLDEALAAAGAGRPERLTARGGPMLAFTRGGLLRVAVGPGRRQLRAQVDALAALDGAPEAVRRRVPWPIASGTAGLAEWTLEPLLPGDSVAVPPAAECVEFLAALHSVGGPARPSLAESAGVVARASGEEAVREIGARLDAELASVPRGFGHGDFFAENLLVSDGRLTGVVDWDSAGPGRLPLLDVLHLVLTSRFGP